MADVYERLSSITFSQIDNDLKTNKIYSKLNENEKLSKIHSAFQKIARMRNSLGKNPYEFDTISDANKVLTPTLSGIGNLYTAYLKIKFGEYDGEDTVINDVDATKILLSIDEGNIVIDDTDSQSVIYTIPITGVTLNRTFRIMPPTPHYIDINVSGNNLIVIAPKNHVAFDIEIEKKKEV